ncbi:MAG: DUF3035 domain-containing protein [Micavibrio sp.]
MRNLSRLVLLFAGATLLSACDSAKEQLGLTRSSPDEFAVVKRAPLEMPPEFTLRPPEPGAPRPQEQATADQARSAILGDASAGQGQTKGEMALLQSADARFNPDIRQIVNEEATRTERKNEPVVKKLLNIGGDSIPPATVIDPQAEAERLKRNAAEGRPVTEGETPVIED